MAGYGERFFHDAHVSGETSNKQRGGARVIRRVPVFADGRHGPSTRRFVDYENVTRYEIIVHTKDNVGSMIGPRCVERVSRAYWSGFLLVRGNTVAPCLQCSEWTEDPIVPASLFLCRWDMRAPADQRTDGRTDRESLFPFASTPSPLSSRPVPSLSIFSLRVELSTHLLCLFPQRSIRSTLPILLLFLHLCASSVGHLFPVADNSAFHLVFPSYSSIPHLVFFFFFPISLYLSISLFLVSFFVSQRLYYLCSPSPLSCSAILSVLHVLLAWHAIFLPILFLSLDRLWRIATSLLLRSSSL